MGGENDRTRSATAFRLLATRDLGLLLLGESISQIGDGLTRVVLLWFAYQTSRSVLSMSLVGVLQTLPPLVLGPVIGVYLDRLRKRPALIVISLARCALVSMIPILHGLRLLSLHGLYAIILVASIVAAVAGPALTTAVPLIVAPSDLAAGNALVQGTATVGMMLGPPVAGIGISLVGISNVLYIDAATFAAFALCAAFMRLPEREIRPGLPVRLREIADELREGLVFLFRREGGILLLTLVAGFQNIGASAFVFMLPAFVKQDIVAGSVSLGILWSAFGVGMLLASVSIAMLGTGGSTRLLRVAFSALVLGGASIGAFGLVRVRLGAVALMVIIGWSAAAFNPIVISLVQASTPADLRARVLTAFNSANMAAVMIGMLVFGWAADSVGHEAAIIVMGGVLVVTAIALTVVTRLKTARRLLGRAAF
jgi:predicted MFS family arabinose efflux permease